MKPGRGATRKKPLEEMTEPELAAYYQGHKEDQDMWEAHPAPPQVAGTAPVRSVFSVRFSRAELETIDEIARQHGLNYSEAIRRAVLAYGSARRWEYCDQLAAENDIVPVANELGAAGWELVATTPHSPAKLHLVFKRPAVG